MQMAAVLQVFSKLLPILALIVLGSVLRHTRFVSAQVIEGIKKLAVQLTLPVVIFLSLLELDFEVSYVVLAGAVFLVSILLLCAGTGIAKRLHWGNPYLPALFTGFENGMLGYGVLTVALGRDRMYPIIIMDLGQTLFFALVFVTYMRVKNGEIASVSVRSVVKGFVTNAYVWASLLAIVLKAGGAANWIAENPLTQGFPLCLV